MTDTAWIDAALTSARPQAVGALLRYFRNLDTAEEAFQNACLRALKSWPQNGPPRDPAAWLIMVGRNVAIDEVRRHRKQEPLPEDEAISDLDDAEDALAERLDGSHYRDDILRLLFICCHPDLPATQQIALALRIVSGLTVKQIARAFLVTEAAMEQRITRAKARVADAGVPFETPGAVERSERLFAVAAMIYLIFNEGYSASGETSEIRKPLCEEAIRLARRIEPRGRPGMLQPHQRKQPHDLRLGRAQPEQQPAEPDRLVRQQSAIRNRAGGIAGVEYEVDHRRDCAQALRPLGSTGCLEREPGLGDARLGAGDALLHRRLADQEGARNLAYREARDDAQRQRDLLRVGQRLVAADEHQPQHVVAIMRSVEPLG